jgi:hypothetical protein
MIHVSNQTHSLFFFQHNNGVRQYLDSQTTLQIQGWKPNDNVKIGYVNGRNESMVMIDNQQSLPGTFTIAMNRMMPNITFELDDSAEPTDWTDQQLQCVAQVFQCECIENKCPCMQPANYRAQCTHLIQRGVVTDAQLDAILEELFE